MGLSLIALLMMTGTLSLRNLITTIWNELECFLPTVIVPYILNLCFCRNNRTPFDLAECETELVDTIRILFYENGFLLMLYVYLLLFLLFYSLEDITILE
jgi:NADH:ubiquinone oxidoreductase subunit H